MLVNNFAQMVISCISFDTSSIVNLNLIKGTNNTQELHPADSIALICEDDSVTTFNTLVLSSYYTGKSFQGLGTYLSPAILLGSGTTPATVEDYYLETLITTLTHIRSTKSRNNNTLTFTTTWQNNTGAAITINEFGVHMVNKRTTTKDTTSIMYTRTVSEEPVVMQPGDSRTFTVSIDFSKMLETSTNG